MPKSVTIKSGPSKLFKHGRTKKQSVRRIVKSFGSKVERESVSPRDISKFISGLVSYYDSIRHKKEEEKETVLSMFASSTSTSISEIVEKHDSESLRDMIEAMDTILEQPDDMKDPFEYLESVATILSFPIEQFLQFRTAVMNETVELFKENKGLLLETKDKLHAPQKNVDMGVDNNYEAVVEGDEDPFGDLLSKMGGLGIGK